MSYLSKIGIAIKKADCDKLSDLLAEKSYDDIIYRCASVTVTKDVVTIVFDSVKWYVGEYDDVTFIDKFVRELDWCEYFEFGEDMYSTSFIKGHDKFKYLPLKRVYVPKGW